MLRKEDWILIEARRRRGVYQKDIAAELGVHPRTVRRNRSIVGGFHSIIA